MPDGENEMARQASATAKTTKRSEGFSPPYLPSWFDRLAAWVDRLPGPAWAFYLVLGIGVSVAGSAIEWREGAYPAGTFNPLHVWTLGNFAYLLGLMHYLDKSSAYAIASFRPLLAPEARDGGRSPRGGATFARLAYELTTLPPRPTLIVSIAGAAFVIVTYVFQTANGGIPS